MSGRRAWLLIGLGALLLVLSYPPFRLPIVSFIAFTPAVLLIRQAVIDRDPRHAFRWGFWYGLISQGLVLYWLIVALWHFTPLSALGYLATILILALWHAVLFWYVVRVRLRLPRVPLWVVLPLGWTAVEWAVGHQGDIRFPWLGLGTSLADAPLLIQWADVAGARGVTLWVVWVNVMIAEAAMEWGRGKRERGRVVAVVASVLLVLGYGMWRMRTLPVREVGVVALIQPNEGFREKWDPARADSVVAKLLDMTRRVRALSRPDLVVWPEAAVPDFLFRRPGWDAAFAGLAREGHTPIVAGGAHVPQLPGGDYDYRHYYNAAFFYDSTGDRFRSPPYGKHYLVPIVERVPFVNPEWFGNLRWFGGFSSGTELPIYRANLGRFGLIICYESIFPDLARRYRRTGAEFLVNITNDKWYGATAGPYQHASHLVLRAIETRMGIARAANSGISEFVDPLGRPYAATRLETETVVADRLRTSDVVPLYTRWGDWVGTLVVLATLGFAGGLAAQGWKRGA